MKIFVVLFAIVAVAAAYVSRDVNDWKRDRFMYDLGLDDSVSDRSWNTNDYRINRNFRNFKNFDDSREKFYGTGFDSRENIGPHTVTRLLNRDRIDKIDSLENIRDNRFRDESFDRDRVFTNRDTIKTIDNIDKKYVKYDDDIKVKLLGDRYLVVKQKLILDVLRNVFTTWTEDEKVRDMGRLVDGQENYKNFDKVVYFLRLIRSKNGLLPRGRVFVIKNKTHMQQLNALFNLFVYSKDFNVFKMNVLWARKHINEEMFVHALYAAVVHRDDMVGVKLPAIYEVLPHKFHTSMTLDKARKLRSNDLVKDGKDLIVMNKYTDSYITLNEEGKLAYLTEDIGWNMYNFYFHTVFGSWIGGKDFKLDIERRGEKYLFLLQQILARYRLERYSHGLGDIKDVTIWDEVKTGYNPLLKNFNGLPVSYRKNYYDVRSTGDFWKMDRVNDFGRRIRDAIDEGFVTTYDGGKVDLKRADGINILGNLIQGNRDSLNNNFYGGYVKKLLTLLGGGYIKDSDEYNLTPSVMQSHETVLRDPVTYQVLKKIMKFYYQFKDNLPTYKKDDLFLDGVRVENIKTTPLVTFFDAFDVDISNIIDNEVFKTTDKTVTTGKGVMDGIDRINTDTIVRARHMRLNHKPFTVTIDLNVDKPQKVVIRTFIGPKFDENGKIYDLRRNRDNFVEIDKFTRDLKPGRVTIEKHSRDFLYTVKDHTTFVDIYRRVLLNDDVNQLVDLHVDEAYCGFPDRLVLPKGWVGGLPMQIFVVVTKAKDVVKRDINRTMICGRKTLINEMDDWSLGFPFDRRIDLSEFYTKNMLFKDVLIFHDVGDVRRNRDFDGKDIDSREFLDIKKLY